MRTLSTWWKSLRTHHNESRAAKLAKQAEQVIQLREFNGGLYVCYAGVPLLASEETNEALAQLKEARENYTHYYMSLE